MHHSKGRLIICMSVLIAMILTILPFPQWAAWWRPQWVPLVLAYWVMALPHRYSLFVVFCIGLVLDVLLGVLLGEHAAALVLVTFLVYLFHQQIRVFPVVQQAICMFIFILVYQVILALIQGAIGALPNLLLCWIPALTSMLLWPWVFVILRGWRRHYKIQ